MPYAVLSVLMFGFVLYCVLDLVLTDEARVRNLPKLVWLLLIVVVPLIGGIAWLVGGRPETTGAAPGGPPSGGTSGRRAPTRGNLRGPRGRPAPRRPRGPDDDPDFLRRLDERFPHDPEGP